MGTHKFFETYIKLNQIKSKQNKTNQKKSNYISENLEWKKWVASVLLF